MKNKIIILALLLLVSVNSFSQKFYLGDRLTPKSTQFKLLGISSSTGVHTYKYIGAITDTYFYNRRVGEIIVGLKKGIVVTTIYNLIPEKGDVDVPQSTLDLATPINSQINMLEQIAYSTSMSQSDFTSKLSVCLQDPENCNEDTEF